MCYPVVQTLLIMIILALYQKHALDKSEQLQQTQFTLKHDKWQESSSHPSIGGTLTWSLSNLQTCGWLSMKIHVMGSLAWNFSSSKTFWKGFPCGYLLEDMSTPHWAWMEESRQHVVGLLPHFCNNTCCYHSHWTSATDAWCWAYTSHRRPLLHSLIPPLPKGNYTHNNKRGRELYVSKIPSPSIKL